MLDNVKMRGKILLLVAVALICAFAVGGLGAFYLNKVSDIIDYNYKNLTLPVAYMGQLDSNLRESETLLLDAAVDQGQENVKKVDEGIKNILIGNNDLIKKYLATDRDKEEQALFSKFEASLATYRKARDAAMTMARDTTPEGKIKFNAYYDKEVNPASDVVLKDLEKLNKYLLSNAEKSTKTSLSDANTAIYMTLAILAAAVVLLLLFGLYLARHITGVLSHVTEVSLEMAKNDLTAQLRPDLATRDDEFGDMGRALGSMQDNLKKMVSRLGSIAENIAASSEELHASADQTATASGEVAGATTNIIRQTDLAIAAVTDTASITEQVAASLEEVAATANAVATTASEASHTATEGRKGVEVAVKSINDVGEGASQVAGAITDLRDSSSRIGEIVEMITGIAGQTNLLALNAAIEAARAGEHGRGFAVVAEEVRKLAEESGHAAQEIAELIAKNTDSIQKTVEMMDRQKEYVERGVTNVNASGRAFGQIADLVASLTGQMHGISKSVHEMAEGSQRTVTAVHEIDQGARNVASEVANVSAAAEEQAASTEEIASSSQVLARMAEDLRELAAKFKI